MSSIADRTIVGSIADEESLLYRRVTLRILPILILCYFLSYLDRSNIGYARLHMLSDLGFSESVYGLGAGIFFLGYAFFEIPSNLIMHRVGAKRWIARIMITWGSLSALMMFVSTPTSFYVLRLLLGIAEAGLLPGAILYLTYWYPARRRGQVVAAFMAALPLAGAIGGPLSGWIMREMAGANGWTGWQWLFLLEGLPTVLVGLFVRWYLDDHVMDAKWLTSSDKLCLANNLIADEATASHRSFGSALKDFHVWTFCGIYFSILLGLAAISFWLPAIISSTGITDTFHIGLIALIPYSIAIVCMVLFGRNADRSRERRWHLVFPLVLSALGFTIVAIGGEPVIVIAGLTAAVTGTMVSLGLFWALPTAVLTGTAAAGGIALISTAGIIAGFVSPYMIGSIKTLTDSISIALFAHAAFDVMAACAVVTLIPAKLVNK